MRIAFGLLALVAWIVPAAAQDNPACAQYENPLAYNACLAKLGPKAGATRASSAPEESDDTHAPSWAKGLSSWKRHAHGRVEAVFPLPRGK